MPHLCAQPLQTMHAPQRPQQEVHGYTPTGWLSLEVGLISPLHPEDTGPLLGPSRQLATSCMESSWVEEYREPLGNSKRNQGGRLLGQVVLAGFCAL